MPVRVKSGYLNRHGTAALACPIPGIKGVRALTQHDDTMAGPRAIETVYHGYRFRSRLEARWAVFLDALGVGFEYEKEGFRLESGLFYLPDFFIPSLDAWIEVKGVWEPEREDEVWQKARDLAQETGQWVYVFAGQFTSAGNLVGWEFFGAEDDSTGFRPTQVWWFMCPVCRVWQLGRGVADLPCSCLDYHPGQQAALVDALTRAKQARFEFGEHG